MIAFTIPKDNELLNVAHIVRLKEKPLSKTIEVQLVTGEWITYDHKAAEIIKSECSFFLNMYQESKRQTTSNIIQPDQGSKIAM